MKLGLFQKFILFLTLVCSTELLFINGLQSAEFEALEGEVSRLSGLVGKAGQEVDLATTRATKTGLNETKVEEINTEIEGKSPEEAERIIEEKLPNQAQREAYQNLEKVKAELSEAQVQLKEAQVKADAASQELVNPTDPVNPDVINPGTDPVNPSQSEIETAPKTEEMSAGAAKDAQKNPTEPKEAAEDQLKTVKTERDEFQQALDKKVTSAKTVEDTNKGIQTKLDELNSKLETHTNIKTEAASVASSLKDPLLGATDTLSARLDQTMENATTDLQNATKAKNAAQADLNIKKQNFANNNTGPRGEINEQEVKAAQARFNEASAKFEKAKTQLKDVEDYYAQAKKDLADNKATYKEAKNEYYAKVSSEDGIERVKGETARVKSEINIKQKEIKVLEKKIGREVPNTELDAISEKPKPLTEADQDIYNLKTKTDELNALQKQHADLKYDISKTKWVMDKLAALGEWIWSQLSMGFAFMIPGMLVDAIKEARALEALRDTLKSVQNFGGIKMKIVDGLVSEEDPLSSIFIYSDIPGEYSAKQRRYFVSVGKYGDFAQDYLGSGKITQMVELTTGAVIDSSGVVESMTPLFKPVTITAKSSDKSVQDFISDEYRFVAGLDKKEAVVGMLAAGGKGNKQVNTSAKGNLGVADLFKADLKNLYAAPDATTAISPLLQSSLALFAQDTSVANFGNFSLREMQGIGAVTGLLTSYEEFFINNPDVRSKIINALHQGKDITDQTVLKSLGVPADQLISKGIAKNTRLVGQGIYIYESDTTQAAECVRSKVEKGLHPFVHDYLVCVDQDFQIVPLHAAKVNSNQDAPIDQPVVQWAVNPNIAYVVSLLNGATYPLGCHGQSLKNDQGSVDTTIAQTVLKTLMAQYKSTELQTQLGAMKLFMNIQIADGPFFLRDGVFAVFEKSASERLSNLSSDVLQKIQLIDLLGQAGQGAQLSSQDDDMSIDTKKSLLDPEKGGGVYVYRIDNALSGAVGAMKLPDYVIPVTVNQATGNYMFVPLGMQAAVQSGTAMGRVSTQVTALISLITGQIYDGTYTLFSNTFRTNVLSMDAPAQPKQCTGSTPGLICINGYVVQDGGQNAPLATAFMETDLNPLNQKRTPETEIKMWPFYFMLLKYDYCSSGIINPTSSKTDLVQYLSQGYPQVTQCANPQTLPVPLYRILPQEMTGMPWPSSVNAALEKTVQEAQSLDTHSQNLKTVLNNVHTVTIPKDNADQKTWTFVQVHAAWRNALMADENNKWSMILAQGPHNFTANNEPNWSLVGQVVGKKSGDVPSVVSLYSVSSPGLTHALSGLWVAARYNSVSGPIVVDSSNKLTDGSSVKLGQYVGIGAQFGLRNQAAAGQDPLIALVQAGTSFSIKSFDQIGADFSEDSTLNALINIGSGVVLIRLSMTMADGSKKEIVAPVVNGYQELYEINPTDVTQAFLKTTGMTLNAGLQAQLNVLQSGRLNNFYGPNLFGPFTLFITRDQVNSGNYIYQVFENDDPVTAVAKDYLVAVKDTVDGALQWGGPIDLTTTAVVSLVSGIKYTRSHAEDLLWQVNGQDHIIEYDTLVATKSGTLSLDQFAATIMTILEGNSLNSIESSLKSTISQANQAYVKDLVQKIQQQQAQDLGIADMSYEQLVVQLINTKKTSFVFPTTLTRVAGTGSDSGNMYQDSNGNYYVRQTPTTAAATTSAQGFKTVGYYAFNIASVTASGQTQAAADIYINQFPTGVYFEITDQMQTTVAIDQESSLDQAAVGSTLSLTGTINAVNVLSGSAAITMATAHGVTIDQTTGKQSITFAVERKALAMADADKNLAGGKDGVVMKLIGSGPALTSADGTSSYLYYNIANASALLQTGIGTSVKIQDLLTPHAPSDILLQVNPKKGAPYYVSLVSGLEYSIDGQPMAIETVAYLPQKTDGTFITQAPLVVWGQDEAMTLFMPYHFSTTDSALNRFAQYRPIDQGVMYQYTTADAAKIYNFTYLNPAKATADNPRGIADGGVYKVEAKSPKVVIKSWAPDLAAVETKPLTIQAAGNMATALQEAQQSGLIASQTLYAMMNIGYTQASDPAPLYIDAYFSESTDQWNVYDVEDSENPVSLGVFKKAVNSDGSAMIIPTVLKFLGQRDVTQGATQLSQMSTLLLNNALLFKDNSANSENKADVTGFIWMYRYFALDPIKHNWYNNSLVSMSFVQAISPLLYCNGQDMQGACTQWPTQAVGSQLPHDVAYFGFIYKNTSYVYQFQFPQTEQPDLVKQYYMPLKKMPVTSSQGVLTLVPFLNVNGLTQLNDQVIGRPGSTGSFADYKTTITAQVTDFYDKKIKIIQDSLTNSMTAATANNTAQQNLAYQQGKPRPTELLGQPVAVIPAGKSVSLSTAQSQSSLKSSNSLVNTQVAALQEQKAAGLKRVADLFTTMSGHINQLYYDSVTKTVVYKVTAKDAFIGAEAGQYISYPAVNKEGSFVFDATGVPTGAVISGADMQAIQGQLGGLVVAQDEPLRLTAPKMISDAEINLPLYVMPQSAVQ